MLSSNSSPHFLLTPHYCLCMVKLLSYWRCVDLPPSILHTCCFLWQKMASLLPARTPCLTYTQIKHHPSYEDFTLVTLHPSESDTPPTNSLRVLCLTLSLHLLQNSVLVCTHVCWRQDLYLIHLSISVT